MERQLISFFDIFYLEKLDSMTDLVINSALKKLNCTNESYYWLIKGLLEGYHLKFKNAMFHEYLFGYRRSERATNSRICVWFVVQFAVPRLRKLLDQRFEELKFGERQSNSLADRVLKLLWPLVNALLESSNLAFLLLFTCKKSGYYSLLTFLQRIHIVHAKEQTESGIRVVDWTINLIKYAIPSIVMTLHSLEGKGGEFFHFPSIPSPRQLEPAQKEDSSFSLPKNPQVCPICRNLMLEEACIPTGYRFCSRCISKYIEQHAKCPITSKPISKRQIIKIFRD